MESGMFHCDRRWDAQRRGEARKQRQLPGGLYILEIIIQDVQTPEWWMYELTVVKGAFRDAVSVDSVPFKSTAGDLVGL